MSKINNERQPDEAPQLYAHPFGYEGNFAGFHFSTLEEYAAGTLEAAETTTCTSFIIEFIGGYEEDEFLFKLLCGQGCPEGLVEFFQALMHGHSSESFAKLFYSTQHGGKDYHIACTELEDITIFDGTASDCVYDLVETLYEDLPGFRFRYFNYDILEKDMIEDGELFQFTIFGHTWTVRETKKRI